MSSDLKKQLVVRTGSVRRLGADYSSYQKEYNTYSQQLSAVLATSSSSSATPETPSQIKKYRELVAECIATLHDIRIRLEEACSALATFMSNNTEFTGTVEWEKAQKTLNENRSHLIPIPEPSTSSSTAATAALSDAAVNHSTSTSSSPTLSSSLSSSSSSISSGGVTLDGGDITNFAVAIYGGSQNTAEDPAYQDAYLLGQVLAQNEYHLVNGGYSGLMEAISAGAATVKNATIEGIISPLAFPFQTPRGNQYLTHHTVTNDLPQRVTTFLSRAQAFIVLPGSLGTLTELCLTWDVSAVSTLRGQKQLLLLIYRKPWQQVIDAVRHIIPISDHFMSVIRYVDNHQDVLNALNEAREQWKSHVASNSSNQSTTSTASTATSSTSH